jgi:hypothetical protein
MPEFRPWILPLSPRRGWPYARQQPPANPSLHVKSRGDIPIILCCSEDDEPALAKVVDELLREGMAPELVPGVEFDGNLLSAAVDAAAADALFVLCISMALDKTIARKLTGLFSARSGRGQRIVSTAFTPSRPLAILPAIRGALREMRLADDSAPDEDHERATNLRDVVEAFAEPELAAVPTRASAVDTETLARELALGMAEAAAILERRDEQESARARANPRPSPRASGPSRAPSSAQSAAQLAAVPARVQPASGTIERRLESTLPHVEELVTDGEPSRQIPRSMLPAPGRALADEPQGNRWLLAFAGIGIAGIVVLAVLQLFRPGAPEPPPRGVGDDGAGVPASNDGGARPADRPRREDEGAPVAGIDAGTASGGAEAKHEAKIPGDTGTAVVDRGHPVEPAADVPTPRDAVPPPPRKGAVSKRDVEEAALVLATQEGKLARVGGLFVSRGGSEELTWTDANGRCHGRRVNGVGGFRLPGVTELRRLRGAKLIAGGSWWSRSKGAEDDEAVAFDADSGASNVYLTIEPNGRVVCVRTL